MPTITFRLSEQERAAVQAAASRSGVSVSDYLRQLLAIREQDLASRVEDVERRLARLEELAQR